MEFSDRGRRALGECRRIHAAMGDKQWSGKPVMQHRELLRQLVRATGCKTALDYGCGKALWRTYPLPGAADFEAGGSFEQYIECSITGFDPAVPEFEARPDGQFDLVMCANVLGLVAAEDLPSVLGDVFGYAGKAVFFQMRLTPPVKPKKAALTKAVDDLVGGPERLTREFWLDTIKRPPGWAGTGVLVIEGAEHQL